MPARASRAGQAKPCLLSWPRDDAREHRHTAPLGTRRTDHLLLQHPRILRASPLAGVHDQRTFLQRDAGHAARHDAEAAGARRSRRMHPSLMPRKKGTLPSGFARERERCLHRAGWSSRSRASAGFSSPRRSTCRARSAASGRQASPWRPIRSISARAARATSGAPSPSLRRPAPPRPRRQGVGRARRLTSGRVHGRAVSGPR